MRFVHAEIQLTPPAVVEVTINVAANVMLMRRVDFGKYERGQTFSYYGGHFEGPKANIRAPGGGIWHLVADLGGAPGNLRASYRILPG